MSLAVFDYHLPPEQIAVRPARPRDGARLLIVQPDGATAKRIDSQISMLPQHLRAGDVLVANDTKVLPTRLMAARKTGGNISMQLIAQVDGPLATCRWQAYVSPARRLRIGERLRLGRHEIGVLARDDAIFILEFPWRKAAMPRMLAQYGSMPLPPYIARKRAIDAHDKRHYQTLFARQAGAIAAPTAGLHFTSRLLARLAAKKIIVRTLTLHVGLGTFAPLNMTQIRRRQLHAEWGELDAKTAAYLTHARQAGRRIIAVGTTSLRLLETACDARGHFRPYAGMTTLFLQPGDVLRASDALLTNFHLPRSSLFMLVCAYSGTKTMQHSYAHAIANGYRFYSYGDACLLYPTRGRHAAI